MEAANTIAGNEMKSRNESYFLIKKKKIISQPL